MKTILKFFCCSQFMENRGEIVRGLAMSEAGFRSEISEFCWGEVRYIYA